MSKANNLGDFLTDIANAIRDKTGEFNAINAQNFSTKIKQDGLMTKVVKYDETSGWQFYYGSSLPWHRWASLPNPTGLQVPSADNIMPKARSRDWKAMTLHDLTTGVNPTVDGFAIANNDFVVRPGSNNIITNQAEFDAYIAEHPFVMEYLLVESSWGGL